MDFTQVLTDLFAAIMEAAQTFFLDYLVGLIEVLLGLA